MAVVNHVLRKINDTKPISLLMVDSKAVAELVQDYNTLILSTARPNGTKRMVLDGDMYGSDVKLFIALLTAMEQLQLLNRYLSLIPQQDHEIILAESHDSPATMRRTAAREDDSSDSDATDAAEAKADRQLKRFMIKSVFITVMSLVLIVIGAMAAIMTRNHTMPDNALIKTIMQTAAEMIKILFNAK